MQKMGWGEGHELGHNMQLSLLNINYADSNGPDKWSSYTTTATENSNNLFPYHNRWHFYRVAKNHSELLGDWWAWNGHHRSFTVLQSAIARINATVGGVKKAVSLKIDCTIKNSFPLGTSPARVGHIVIWSMRVHDF